MIKNTFNILQGIGEKLERRLWRSGILTWEDFISADEINFLSVERKKQYNEVLVEALQHINSKNQFYFKNILKQSDHWRLFNHFKDEAVSLDIETNGYPAYAGGYITVVGLYDGYDYKKLVFGEDLSRESLQRELSQYKYIITFFGSGFDLPFLRESFGINIEMPHFDLCFGSRKVGIKGSLKKIEEHIGIKRDETIKGFDGFDAVRLWKEALQGSNESYELLITYNKFDTVNLFTLADVIYDKLKARTGIDDCSGKWSL